MFRRILVANDRSPGAAKALSAALRIAKDSNVALHMVCVEEIQNYPATIDEVVEDKLEADHRHAEVVEQACREAANQQVDLGVHLLTGHPVPTIADFIASGSYDLLVIGFMGHSALYHRLIGSTTDRLVELAPCAVLVIK